MILSRTTPKARKPHNCYWCGQTIDKGEVHEAWSSVDDGRMVTTRCHAECAKAWDWAHANIDKWYYSEEVGYAAHRRGCACDGPREKCNGCGMETTQ